MEYILGIIYLIVTCAVLINMSSLHIRGNDDRATRCYMICQGMVLIWCSSQLLILLSHNSFTLTVSYLIGNIGVCYVSVFWFYFSLLYTKHKKCKLVYSIPAIFATFHYIAILTNSIHHLYYKTFSFESITHGPLFYSNVLLTYILVIAGAFILCKQSTSTGKILVVTSVLIPVIFNMLYVSGIIKAQYDITPLGFAISVWLTMLATLKYQFIDLKRELAITNEKLLLEQERSRIAQEVHDTAGHTLTMIQSYIKMIEYSISNNEPNTAEYIADAKALTSQGIRELRESINQLRSEASFELVTQGIMQLKNQVKEMPVELTVIGEDTKKYSHLSMITYSTVRESITNTLKYANATKIDIVLRFKEASLELIIGDDGIGCDNIVDNNGLRGIRQRVEKAGGTVKFVSSTGEGFLTRVTLYL